MGVGEKGDSRICCEALGVEYRASEALDGTTLSCLSWKPNLQSTTDQIHIPVVVSFPIKSQSLAM